MSNIDLLLDEENELTFALSIEGSRPATAQCRLVLERDEMSLVFDSDNYNGEEVTVVLPPLKHVLKEGQYNMDLEVIVEDKYFKPLSLTGNFEKSIEIKAAPITRSKRPSLKPNATLSEVKVKNRSSRVSSTPERLQEVPVKIKKKQPVLEKPKTKVSDKDILAIIEALRGGNL